MSRAEVNGTLGCVYVGCGPETDLERVKGLVATADAAAQVSKGADAGRARSQVGFPGDPAAAVGAAVRLGAGLVAVGVATVGDRLRLRGLPPVVMSAVQLVESAPPLRDGLVRRIGEKATERGFAMTNLLLTTLTFRPLGAAVAATMAAARYVEVQARRRAWADWAGRLAVHEGTYRHDAVPGYERPAPLPPGPGDRYANLAAPVALGAYGLTAVGALSHDRDLALLIAGTPRGPQFGREAFASSVARAVSDRGALALRPEALRRLDRIDTVVLDARVLATGGWTVEGVVPLNGGPQSTAVQEQDGPDRRCRTRAAIRWSPRPWWGRWRYWAWW